MDIESAVASYLGGMLDGVDVSVVVPEPRPGRLVTVQRTGGGVREQLDHPTLAVQSWGKTLMDSSSIAREVDRLMRAAPYVMEGVYGVESTTLQQWPDPDSGAPRYQALYTLTANP